MKGFFDYVELKKFINLVKLHRTLYDPSEKHGPQTTADVWANITAEMNIPSMQVADWKSKWKCLRDTFVKKKKESSLAETPEAAKRAAQWRFFEHMSFLDDFVTKTTRVKTIPRSNGSDYQHYTIIKHEDGGEGESCEDDTGDGNSSIGKHPGAESDSSPSKKKRRVISNNPQPVPISIHANTSSQIATDDDDEALDEDEDEEDDEESWNVESGNSRSFFMSCAYRMDRLPERVQSYLQLQVSQLFFNAENPEVPPVPIMSLPPPLPQSKPC